MRATVARYSMTVNPTDASPDVRRQAFALGVPGAGTISTGRDTQIMALRRYSPIRAARFDRNAACLPRRVRACFLTLTAVYMLAFLAGCSRREPVAPTAALAPTEPPPVGTERNEDLVVAGGTLIGVGSLALTSSTIMGVVAMTSSFDSDDGTDASGPATASLLSLALSQAALGAGIPMVVIGVRGQPRPSSSPPASTPSRGPLDGSRGPAPGITTVWSF